MLREFAEHHLLLQLSDADPTKRDSVLNVASNVMKHYGGPDFVAVEVIVFDRGIDLVLEGSEHQERLSAKQGFHDGADEERRGSSKRAEPGRARRAEE